MKSEKLVMEQKYDTVSSAQLTFSCRRVFVSLFLTVGEKIFGSGTKLYVTEQQVVKPVVSVYPAASRDPLKNHLLCVASAMFPPEVQFSWKRLKQNGVLEELNSREGEQLELRESGRSTSILVLGQHDPETQYYCSVKHEEVIEVTAPPSTAPSTPPPPTLPPSTPPPPPPPPFVPPPLWSRERLLCLQYTVLIVKSVVYCFGLSLMMILRNKGPSTSSTHAD
ncbi:ras-associated and pleckstrin homology domains-containing protein 1-like isoform X1 [Salarias fasciatus]|uniref:ras-associated and pleckstrin homology domains-containing protein 1-like isoform X1 n=1 Tax=Salarias fasciatus TaxID=181472 RepID=UPI001176613E|nr:ras-associated and pleckstrin homology domains-containing protein 1-like isoform X1 [Salarias fasciatus]